MSVISSIPFLDFGGAGPILHFAHANAYPPGCYRQFVAALRSHYRVLAIEQRPLWPHANLDELRSWDILADDLIHFFEQEGLGNVIGVGHSSGAVATMLAALKRPSLFRTLILIEPVFLPPHIIEMVAADLEMIENLPLVRSTRRRRNRWPSRQAAFDHFRAKTTFQRWPDAVLWDYVQHGLHENGTGAVVLTYRREWEAHVYVNFPRDVWQHVPQVTHPTLALRGAESDTIFPEAWQLWQELQPQATFVEVAEAGHMLTMERPSITAQIILDYLQKGEK